MVQIELEYIALMVITLAVIFIGVNILFTVFGGSGVTDFIFDGMSKFVGRIFSGRAYNICEDFNNKELTLEQFQSLLQAMDREECGSAQIRIRFSLTENDLKKIVSLIGSDKTLLILEGAARPFGANSILVYGNPGPRPLKRDDKLELVRAGTPRPDIMITLLEQGCDPTDDDCDASCSYKSGVCDPLCYKHEQRDGAQCDIDCVDTNGDGVPDSDGICDLDCYNNKPDPNNAYDPDCIKARQQSDSICDPDSNGVQDGVCDPDCVGDNFICDPDCDGQAGRPYDRECYECDKACNNYCSRVCITGEDPDCAQGFGSKSACCGNNKCESGESCSNCNDCPPGATCKGLYTGKIQQGSDAICCPQGDASDEYGCGIYKIDLKEGEKCSCDAQCSQAPTALKCQQSTDPPKLPGTFCCPDGKQWDGTQCVIPKVYNIVFVPLYYNLGDSGIFMSDAQASFNHFLGVSPFKECSNPTNHVKMLAIDPKDCQVSSCSFICTNCISTAMDCVQNSPYSAQWDKVIVLCKGSSCPGACGCAGSIPSDASATNFETCRGTAPYKIPSHEGGHSFGLYHMKSQSGLNGCWDNEGGPCAGPNAADCSRTPSEISQDVMAYCPNMVNYGPAAYDYLKNVIFKDYLVGC